MADVKYKVEVVTKQAVNDVNKLAGALDKSGKAMNKVDKNSKKMSAGFGSAKIAILATVAAMAVAATAAVKIASNFETLRTTLATVSGGAEQGALAFEFIQSVAEQLPGSLEETTRAYTKLLALGISPTEDALISFANTASATGKSLDQFVEAVADATTGEFERLKEFGIKVKQETDSLKVTFQGVTKSIGKDSASIQKFLQGIGENQFAGAATEQMDTLAGRFSNFKDTLSKFADEVVNSSGGMDLLKAALVGLTAAIEFMRENMGDLADFFAVELPKALETWQNWLGLTGDKTKEFATASTSVINDFKEVFAALFTDTRVLGVAFVDGLVRGFLHLSQAWAKFVEGMSFGFDTAVNTIQNSLGSFINKFIEVFNTVVDFTPFDSLKLVLFEANKQTETWGSRMARVNAEYDQNLKLHTDSIALWLQDIENNKELNRIQKDDAIAERTAKNNAFKQSLIDKRDAQFEAVEAEKAAEKIASAMDKTLKDLTQQTLALSNASKTNAERINETTLALLENKDALVGVTVTAEEFNQAMAQLTDNARQESQDWADGWKIAFDAYADDAGNAARQAKDVFADSTAAMEDSILSFVKTGKFGFKELGQAIIDSLLNAQIQQLTASIFGVLGGGSGQNIFAGAFAQGGFIPAGQVGLVGESGPELIRGPASVTPITGGSGGGGDTFNITINAIDAQSFDERLASNPAFIFAIAEEGRRTLPSGSRL